LSSDDASGSGYASAGSVGALNEIIRRRSASAARGRRGVENGNQTDAEWLASVLRSLDQVQLYHHQFICSIFFGIFPIEFSFLFVIPVSSFF
jgi:hypothetical protein